MVPHIEKFFRGKCPHCANIIEYHIVSFYIENDTGEMICICDNCDDKFKITCANPNESYIEFGATKDSYVDYDIESSSNNNEIQSPLAFSGNLNAQNMIYDLNKKSIYHCNNCDENLEVAAYKAFENEFSKIINAYSNYTTIDVKGYGYNPEKAVVAIDVICSCTKKNSAIFYKTYNHASYTKSDFYLANIIGSKKLELLIDGTMSKSECMEVLKKMLVRWELLFDKIYIISPFVGYQRTEEDDLIDIWFGILRQLSNKKAKIITRTASLNSFKKAFSNTVFDYKTLVEYKMSPKNIDEAVKLQASHAKIYCAVSSDRCEIIHGSANIAYGPSKEQITFRVYNSYADVYERFLQPLNVKNIPNSVFPNNENQTNGKSNVLFSQDKNFNAIEITKDDFFRVLLEEV